MGFGGCALGGFACCAAGPRRHMPGKQDLPHLASRVCERGRHWLLAQFSAKKLLCFSLPHAHGHQSRLMPDTNGCKQLPTYNLPRPSFYPLLGPKYPLLGTIYPQFKGTRRVLEYGLNPKP